MATANRVTPRSLFRVCVMALLLTLAGASMVAAAEASRSFHWQSETSEEIDGLYVLKVQDQGMVSRVLTETPTGPVVLTGLVDPVMGVTTTRILDPETGWWAELAVVDDLQATSLDQYFQRATQVHVAGSDRDLAMKLTTEGGFRLTRTFKLTEPETLYQEFSQALQQDGFDRRLRAEIPTRTMHSILFLHRWLSPRSLAAHDENFAHGLRPVLEVLAPLVQGDADHSSQGTTTEAQDRAWNLTTDRLIPGLLSTDDDRRAAQLELLSQFQMVENTDPLSDLRDHPTLQPTEPRPR